ncbi:MAG: pyridoxal-phosphate dependent enzyme [Bacteriovoracales bacterium]|nr:pyridoxal-phosphate dependent enzyme [Bacteriovoracales bacterium]
MMMKGSKANILEAIGETPIVRLSPSFTGVESDIYVKLEYLNPGGSTKDRIGVYMIDQAVKNSKLPPGGTIIEGTSGNTGVGIAMYAALHGYKCIFVINDKQSKEKIDNLKAYGAKVVICPTDVAPEDPRSYYSVSKKLAQTIPHSYYVNQYDNLWNRETHYKFTAPEIHRQTDGEFDIFMAAVGTGGTISGCATYFKEHCPHIKIVGVDCVGSIVAHYWKTGEMTEAHSYVLEGIGEDFIPKNYDFEKIDDFEVVGDKESFLITRRLLSEQAIYCGGSAGAGVLAAIHHARKLKSPKKILVLLHDSGDRYRSKIFNDDWMSENNYFEGKLQCSLGEIIQKIGKEKLVAIVETSHNISHVLDLMEKTGLGAIPVSDGKDILGVIKSERLTSPLFEQTLNLEDNVSTIYSQDFVQLDVSDPVEKALEAFKKQKVVIVCSNGRPIDILSEKDVLKLMRSLG